MKKQSVEKRSIAQTVLGAVQDKALVAMQDSLNQSVKLAFPKKNHAIFVFTEVSDAFWARIVTQTKTEQLQQWVTKQQHEPQAFRGGNFTGAQKNSTIYEKEAYTIVQTFERMDYLFWGAQLVHVSTDQQNLLYVFAPLALCPNSPRHVLSKVHRWAIHLSRFEFVIDYIEGANNVFADVLTR